MSNAALMQILDRWMGAHEGDPDSSFLNRFLTRRDEAAFAALVHRHGPLVYGTCLRILGNRDESDDAFQAVFFVLARRAHTLKPDRGLGPWLHGVALRVARKLRGQIVRRRLREMAAAKPEQVETAQPEHDFWALLDDELARLPLPLREVLLLCDLGGQSHSRAAESLGLAKGTVTKRLARAREELATRLKRRGIMLGVAALSTLIATRTPASVPAPLVLETAKQAVAFSIGQVGGSLTAKTLAEGVMRSLKVGGFKAWFVVGVLGLTLAGGLMLAGGPGKPTGKKVEQPQARADARPDAAKTGTMWKENYTIEYQDSLPVSVAFSADGKRLLTGDTAGEVMALLFTRDEPLWRWKSRPDGPHAVVAFSADQKKVYATTRHGVRILDAATGKDEGLVEAKDSNPTALGVFPTKPIDGKSAYLQIVFGSARGYFIKVWPEGELDKTGTIETSTVAKGAKPADVAAVPLAVDPKGRSAIMTGPRDATGQITGRKGKNVLWAYVCGDYSDGSPGNRYMVGHAATVVSAAWAKEGSTAVTGDADGRVIVWDAKTMKESRRVELGGRILALAVTNDGMHTAAYVRGKRGGDVYVWETAKPAKSMRPIHSRQADLGSEPYASLTFSPDGKRLAGCVIDRKWLQLAPKTPLSGKVHVWELAPEPKAQPAPRHIYTIGSSSSFVVLHNNSILMSASKEGALDFIRVTDGVPQARTVLGKFAIGRMKLSSDRKWLAMEKHPPANNRGNGVPAGTFEVGVYEGTRRHKATIPSCEKLLDVASGGKVVAVVRAKKIELWNVATAKLLKSAPFQSTRIDAARFSPDGKLLAISDRNQLVLWRWEENKHERIDLGRPVGSLTFSPDGKYLAEGPAPRENIQIRDLETRKVVQALSISTKRSMNVAGMVYTQGGRVLIACDNIASAKGPSVRHRIHLWDTVGGSIAHQLAVPAGLPCGIDVTPNGRYMAVMLDDGAAGMKLSVWRLDGEKPVAETEVRPSAATNGAPARR
jgi:RNA polymerase sigma factor (sigma-70 family)